MIVCWWMHQKLKSTVRYGPVIDHLISWRSPRKDLINALQVARFELLKPTFHLKLSASSQSCEIGRSQIRTPHSARASVADLVQKDSPETGIVDAMCEELSRNAADLTYENENLRRVCKPIH
ncbi:hypothetical protein YC2023_090419 [Brassica napus]